MGSFYAYIHKTPKDDEPFYVGKGHGQRARTRFGRSKAWREAVDIAGGFVVEIDLKDVDEQAAKDREAALIKSFGIRSEGGKLVNVRKRDNAPPSIGKAHVSAKIDAELCDSLDEWITAQEAPWTKVAAFEIALKEFLEKRNEN